jgi:hypothetical protein
VQVFVVAALLRDRDGSRGSRRLMVLVEGAEKAEGKSASLRKLEIPGDGSFSGDQVVKHE